MVIGILIILAIIKIKIPADTKRIAANIKGGNCPTAILFSK